MGLVSQDGTIPIAHSQDTAESFYSCWSYAGRQTCRALDVQWIFERTDVAGFGLRSGAGDQAADAAAISGIRSTGAARCRHLCDVNGRSGAEISEWPRKDLASHWIWKTVYSVTGAAHCCGK